MSDQPPFDPDEPGPPGAGGRGGAHFASGRGRRPVPRRGDAFRADREEPEYADLPHDEPAGPAVHDFDDDYDHDDYDDLAHYDDEYDEYGHGDEYVELSRGSSRARRVLTVVLVVVVVLVVALAAGGLWVQGQIDPSGDPGEVREIEVPEGSTSDDIGKLLADEGIITSDFVWGWYLRINGGGPFQAGIYELAENSAMGDVVDVLAEGPRPPEERSVTVPEGLTLREIVQRLADPEVGLGFDAAELQSLLDSGQVRSEFQPPDQPSNEGILFPETYRIAADADALAVLTQMVGQLDATMHELDVTSAQERFNLTPYEILIVASLIEEETKVDAERPRVAQVIYNRMREGMTLGIDATSRYEAELEGRDRESIDFTSDSPYNTRVNQGLPPTPIASPGRASIEAALNPEDGPWLYYVLQDTEGNHFFTDDYNEFLAAKDECAAAGLGCG